MTAFPARRRFSRIFFNAPARLFVDDDDQGRPCRLLDISLNGALVSKPEQCSLMPGQRCKLEFQLTDSDISLLFDARVIHVNDTGVGLVCKSMTFEHQVHLQRLVEWNLADARLLYRELSQLGKTGDDNSGQYMARQE